MGVDRQRQDADRLVTARGWQLVDHYVDNDISAAGKVRRPRFEALMQDVEGGRLDVVVGWTLDRICRTARDRLRLLELGRERGLVISLVRGSDMDLSTPAGRLAADILGAAAQHEIDVKGDRQRRAAEQAAALGKAPSGPRAFGFTLDRSALVPVEAAAIRDAYRAVLAGATLAGIARQWNGSGLRSSRHAATEPPRWSAETVKVLLLKARNAGLREHRDQEVGPARWPAIVPEETYRAAAALLTDPNRRQSTPVGRYLLSGVARCGVCNQPVQAGSRRGTYHSYRCRSLGHVARRGDVVDDLVSKVVIARLSRPDARDLLVDHQLPDVEVLREKAQALRTRLDALATEFAEGELTASQLRIATERLRTNLAAAEREIADAGRVDVLGDLVSAGDVAEAWAAIDTDRQRAVVGALMSVTLMPVGRGSRRFDPASVRIEPLT
nr:recombinase family protein [Pseudonocardia acidicola]